MIYDNIMLFLAITYNYNVIILLPSVRQSLFYMERHQTQKLKLKPKILIQPLLYIAYIYTYNISNKNI